MKKKLNMTQSPFQRFLKCSLLISQKLPPHLYKYGIDSVNKFYNDFDKIINF